MAHIHEKIDFVAETFIVNDGAVLLRKHDKYKLWLAPGGHIELDEEPQQAAIREAKEEVGLDVELVGNPIKAFTDEERELLVPRFMNRHHVSETHEHIALVFFARSNTRDFSQGETEVSDEIRWFTKEELDDPAYGIIERIRYYAHTALEEVR
jgi:8-oxo-dGTP pyrophosphatase MutT (NUDIX family)